MGARRPFVGGNWKMNLSRQEAVDLARAVAQRFAWADRVDAAICPAMVHLADVGRALDDLGQAGLKLGAQDFYYQKNGAFTGEVSLTMLADLGVKVVLVGHSERRHVIGEGDELINRKVRAALDAGFEVILCTGEKLEQRELGQTDAVNAAQTCYGLAGVSAAQMARVTIAYEPVWAIGTGKTATREDAQAAQAAVRTVLGTLYGNIVADGVRIQYGGSCNAKNAAELFAQPDVDGGLIGGASLKADDFLAILKAAAECGCCAGAR